MPEWLFATILWAVPVMATATFVTLGVWFVQEIKLGYYRGYLRKGRDG